MIVGLGGSGANVLSDFKRLSKLLPVAPRFLAIDHAWMHEEEKVYGLLPQEAIFLGDPSIIGNSDEAWLNGVIGILEERLRVTLLDALTSTGHLAAGSRPKVIVISSLAGRTGRLLLPKVSSQIRKALAPNHTTISAWILGDDLFQHLLPAFPKTISTLNTEYPFTPKDLDELVLFDYTVITPDRAPDGTVYHFIAQELAGEFIGIRDTRRLYCHEFEKSQSAVLQDINAELIQSLQSDPRGLINLEPRRFEELVAAIWTARGYSVTLTPRTRDGGKDVYAAQHSEFGDLLYVIECKRYAPDRPVGVEIVRSLYGVAQHERATMGVVATTSTFTKDALEFQSKVPYQLSLRDFESLVQWLQSLKIRNS